MDSNNPNNTVSLSIDSEGSVLKCAKGLNPGECGFTPGSAVCGKCGAIPVEMKVLSSDMYNAIESELERLRSLVSTKQEEKSVGPCWEGYEQLGMKKGKGGKMVPNCIPVKGKSAEELPMDEEDEEELPKKKKRQIPVAMEDAETEDDSSMELPYDMDEESEESEESSLSAGDLAQEENSEGEMADEDAAPTPVPAKKKPAVAMDDEEDSEDEDVAMMDKFRKARLGQMGVKSLEMKNDGYKCAVDGNLYSSKVDTCANCKGGCHGTKGQVTLLHAEGYAQTLVKGDIIDSGFVPEADMFAVTIRRKDAKVFDIFINGATGQIQGHRLNDDFSISSKNDLLLVTFDEAGDIAVKTIPGMVVSIEPDSFEGIDSYAVEVETKDGKSYDVFVSLDGNVLGYDKYEEEDIEMIEAEAAEIALKRAFSDETRQEMAESGGALPDGSYPIKTESDLRNAISAYGRAKDKTAAKAHIIKRARELGKENLIPANWVMGEKSEFIDGLDDDFKKQLLEFQLLSEETSSNS